MQPPGVVIEHWQTRLAEEVHALLEAAYAQGAGFVAPYALWLREFERDHEFDQASCFLAFREVHLAGVALCWASAFIKDLAVAEAERSAGLGTFLLRTACDHFEQRGATAVDLKVERDNERAMRLYLRLGFEPAEVVC